MYYFAQECDNEEHGHVNAWFKGSIYRILDNGTSIDLEREIPFAKEYWAANGKIQDCFWYFVQPPQDTGLHWSWSFVQAPFYQRFYEHDSY